MVEWILCAVINWFILLPVTTELQLPAWNNFIWNANLYKNLAGHLDISGTQKLSLFWIQIGMALLFEHKKKLKNINTARKDQISDMLEHN